MSDLERDSSARRGRSPWDEDLDALRETSARDLPTLGNSMSRTRSRSIAATHWKEHLMSVVESPKGRPWIVTAGIATLIALVALVVPISYERTTGHDVSLVLGDLRDVASAAGIAQEMKSALGSEQVSVSSTVSTHGSNVTLQGFVPARSGMNAAARAQALAKELNARGFTASATTTPRRERVSGSVYAYARDLSIRVETEGKTAAQIEDEIRQQLAAAGVTNTTVSVTDEGKARQVMIKAENHGQPGEDVPRDLTVELTKNGAAMPAGDGTRVEMRRMKTPDGTTLTAIVTSKVRTATVTVPHVDQMSDAALADRVRSILRDAGLDLDVQVTDGHLQIQDMK